ncbi:SAM-dependent methyltransferase [Kangiella sp.]|uniref:SAM-dependent methyltransferase n=1 Tax=Kangiella sp. TaxID=1920245 RepID=UPI003A8ED5A9
MNLRQFKPEKLFAPRGFTKPEINTPQYLEIGAGRGKHALMFAQNNPDKYLIAIERTRNKFNDFADKSQQLSLNNLLPIHADAIPWVVHALEPSSLAGVFILYPNPEPKNPSQRWLNMPFFEFLLSRMQDNAKLILATNIQSYIEEAEQQAKDLWQLTPEVSEVDKQSERTHFEVKYLARGETCWQLELVKPNGYKTRFDEWAVG